MLGEGFDGELIKRALTELVRRRLNPSTLPSLVNELANQSAVAAGARPSWEL